MADESPIEEQISFRKYKKNNNSNKKLIQQTHIYNTSMKDEVNAIGKRRSSVNIINKYNPSKKRESKKNEDSDSCSSLDIQKAGMNSKNTRIVGGNKHSLVEIKNSSRYNLKKSNNSKSQSSFDKNSSENTFDKINLDNLLNLKENTVLGVNLLNEDNTNIKNKKQYESSSITGSIQMYFDSSKRKKFKDKLKKAKNLIKRNQQQFINNITEAIKKDNINLIEDLMLSETNKIIYKRILKKDTFINMMLINKRKKMLLMILDDSYYKYNPLFPFEYIASKLKTREKNIFKSDEICQFILNIVESGLFEKKLTKVIGWFLLLFDLKQEFIHFISINREYYYEEKEICEDDDFELINEYRRNNNNFNSILILCLDNGLEELAIELVHIEGKLENGPVIRCALKNKNKEFLKYIWEAPIISHQKMKNDKKLSILNKIEKKQIDNTEKKYFNNGMNVINISSLIETKKNKYSILKDLISEMISTWKFLDMDNELFYSLFKCGLYDEINILTYRYPNNKNWVFTPQNFKTIIRDKAVNLILLCLQVDECKEVLKEDETQKNIISNYLTKGHLIYYGAELLNNIPATYFNNSFSNEFIDNIIIAIKNRVIINCHSPVLTCLILYEIISNISQSSINFSSKCAQVSGKLMEICKNIDEANSNEKYIKFLLSQKDSKGRSGYEIAASTPGCTVLESPKIATIVDNMWQGKLRFYGFFDFSSLLRIIESPKEKGTNPFIVFTSMDFKKTYFHQIALWKESCSLRFYQESLSTILLIVIYNLYLYFLVNNDEIMTNPSDLPKLEQFLLIIYIIWCCIILFNIPLQIIYCRLSGKRKFSLDFWNYIEISLAIFSFLVLVDTQKIFPKYDENGNYIPSNGRNDLSFIMKATILSINDILVWLRITGILLAYKEFGPLIRMIYLLSIETAKYLVIYLIISIAAANIYTTLFYKASIMYQSFSITFTTLFQGYLNNSKYQNFDYYKKFGAICCIIFVIFGGLILVNMLIIFLSNEYARLSKVVQASHRSTLIKYYKRNKWDKNFGYMILLATPINIINIFVLPIHLFFYRKHKKEINNENINNIEKDKNLDNANASNSNSEVSNIEIPKNENENEDENKDNHEEEKFNTIVSSIYYIVFYFPIIFLIEVVCSFVFIPFAYLAGLICSISISNKTTFKEYFIQLLIFISWIFLGLFVCIYRYVIDLYYLCNSIFINFDKEYNFDKKRIREFIKTNEVKEFIKFIHKRDISEKTDLMNLLRSFLVWENEKEDNKNDKSNSNYLNKLSKFCEIKTKNLNSTIIGLDSKKNSSSISFLTSRMYKRNIIIYEILENFVIDNELYIVDIEKMKMILPYTVNINKDYIKRLIYTNISNIQRALNKKKRKTNVFKENKL